MPWLRRWARRDMRVGQSDEIQASEEEAEERAVPEDRKAEQSLRQTGTNRIGERMGTEKIMTIEERFWPKVDTSGGQDACWNWTAAKSKGYGIMSSKRGCSPHKAYRISWELHNGPIPIGLHVLHKCDNAACVNPQHLFVGTHRDNMDDMTFKGRARVASKAHHGEKNSSSKLTEDQVREIRRLGNDGIPASEIARAFRISRPVCSKIIRRELWKRVA